MTSYTIALASWRHRKLRTLLLVLSVAIAMSTLVLMLASIRRAKVALAATTLTLTGSADAQISNTTRWARYPDVVWTGSELGILWVDSRDGMPEIYFNRAHCHKPAAL